VRAAAVVALTPLAPPRARRATVSSTARASASLPKSTRLRGIPRIALSLRVPDRALKASFGLPVSDGQFCVSRFLVGGGRLSAPEFSFDKFGAMIAPPRMTFATQGAPADIRNTYLKAINASLSGCEPFKFTAELGDAIAGRPIMIRYVDNRDLEKHSGAR